MKLVVELRLVDVKPVVEAKPVVGATIGIGKIGFKFKFMVKLKDKET